MQIDILYSKDNAEHLKAATFVKEAVKNLGISATIIERDAQMSSPRVMVNGFDLINSAIKIANGNGVTFSYDSIAQALERTAWSGV
jgi:hypothetical protein